MNFYFKVRRKIYKAFHPVIGEIWMLHRCTSVRSTNPQQRSLEVTPEFLEQMILEYQAKGYIFISMDAVVQLLQISKPKIQNSKFVVVTFDDGYRDNFIEALPILKKYNVPFIVYVTTNFIDNYSEMWWYPGRQLALSKDELLQLDHDPLCTIGAHTLSHPKLDELSMDDQRREIIESKRQLESWLGHPVSHFSYPHGAHSEQTRKIALQAAFSTIACAWGGPVRTDATPIDLMRIAIKQQ